MKELIKADFYALKKNKKVYVYTSLFAIAYILMAAIGNLERSGEKSLLELYLFMIKEQIMLILILLLGISCYYQGRLFSNRFIMHQVIGQGRTKTLYAKYFVQSIANVIFFTMMVSLALLGYSFVYRIKSLQIFKVLGVHLIIVFLIIRYTIRLISVVLVFKNGVVAAVMNWMIFLVEFLPLAIGQEYGIDSLMGGSHIFVPGQIIALANGMALKELLPKILITTLAEIVVYVFLARHVFGKTELG